MTIEQMRKRIARQDCIERIVKYIPKCDDVQLAIIYRCLFKQDRLVDSLTSLELGQEQVAQIFKDVT